MIKIRLFEYSQYVYISHSHLELEVQYVACIDYYVEGLVLVTVTKTIEYSCLNYMTISACMCKL